MKFGIRMYRHPDRQLGEYTRFEKIHDLYSLGVVLLEIGRLELFRNSRSAMILENNSPRDLKDAFVKKAKGLKLVLAKKFTRAVLTCLTGIDVPGQDSYLFLSSFRSDICETLTEIE